MIVIVGSNNVLNIENQWSICKLFGVNVTKYLKEPGPIASDFFQTLRDFGIRRKLIIYFFSLPLVNFTAEKSTVWKILTLTGPRTTNYY